MFKPISASFAAFALGASTVAVPALAQDSPVVGAWDTKIESPMGEFPATWIFASADEGYTLEIEMAAPEGGGMGGPPPEMTIYDLVIEDTKFSFIQAMATPQGDMEIAITGVVDGDALSAEASTDFGNMPISGTRAAHSGDIAEEAEAESSSTAEATASGQS